MSKIETYEAEESTFSPSPISPDGQIKSYALTNDQYYPQLVIEMTTMPFYKVQVLKGNLEPLKILNNEKLKSCYFVYLQSPTKKTCIGRIESDKLRLILLNTLFNDYEKYILLSADEKVEGEMMLSLCTLANF